jgi:hypothetical protein
MLLVCERGMLMRMGRAEGGQTKTAGARRGGGGQRRERSFTARQSDYGCKASHPANVVRTTMRPQILPVLGKSALFT